MVLVHVEAKKWGHSLGVVIPKDIVAQKHLREHQIVTLLIVEKTTVLKDTFGVLKGKIKKPTQKIKDELRAELYDG